MNIYPQACNEYVNTSGNVRTAATKASVVQMTRALHQMYPMPVEKVKASHLTSFCLSKKEDGTPPAPGTIRARRGVITSFFSWLEFAEIIPTNPSSKLKFSVRPGTGNARTGTWLSEEEVARVLRECGDDEVGTRDRVLLMVGFFTGLRRFELERLKWDDFDRNFTQFNIIGKGNKHAPIGIPPQLADVLKTWRAICPPDGVIFPALKSSAGWSWDPEVGSSVDWQKPLSSTGIHWVVGQAGRRAGFELHPHDMRRTFAGLLEAAGFSIADISRAMRHSNIGTTSVYMEKSPKRSTALTSKFTINL